MKIARTIAYPLTAGDSVTILRQDCKVPSKIYFDRLICPWKRCFIAMTTFLVAFAAAIGMGLLIGMERQFGQHPAGLRTNALVCGGAALYVLMARSLNGGQDTARVAAQIVSGIGFLGGGVILREGLTVRGLTTAATLWCSAAVGSLCGADLLQQAAVATVAIVATNWMLNPVSRWIDRHAANRIYIDTSYRLKVICTMAEERRIRGLLAQQIAAHTDMTLHGLGIQNTDRSDHGLIVADVQMHVRNERVLQEIVAQLNADPSTSSTSWERQS
jgi:putative Mg2+ transporter-C (MgtC) family protein